MIVCKVGALLKAVNNTIIWKNLAADDACTWCPDSQWAVNDACISKFDSLEAVDDDAAQEAPAHVSHR